MFTFKNYMTLFSLQFEIPVTVGFPSSRHGASPRYR